MAFACSAPAPGVIHYDVDACDHCRMTISDPSFAAQLVMRTGKVYRFDDPGCLLSFMSSKHFSTADVDSTWVNDHAHPETLVPAPDATFLVSDQIKAPMAGGMAAFGSRADAVALQSATHGRLETWAQVRRRASS
jgi:copper chaperone NosL